MAVLLFYCLLLCLLLLFIVIVYYYVYCFIVLLTSLRDCSSDLELMKDDITGSLFNCFQAPIIPIGIIITSHATNNQLYKTMF